MSTFFLVGPPPPPVPPPDNGSKGLVTAGWSQAQGYASSAMGSAQSFLSGIAASASGLATIPTINVDVGAISAAVHGYASPAAPIEPIGLGFNLPPEPADAILAAVTPFDVGQAPQFTAVPLPISLPAAPNALTTSPPLAPTLPDVLTPASPNVILPDVPTMLGIVIPGAPVLNIPDFTATLAASPTSPANTFGFAETSYTSALLTDLRARLLEWVDGAFTGLDPTVEQAIWDRGRARENAAVGRKIKEAIRSYASRGFPKPPGSLSVEIQSALQDTQDTLSSQSRDVMVKQADLMQSNRHFAFETAFKVESELITYQNLIAQRAFDTAKYAQQVAIDIFREEVQRYQADAQAYGIRAQVFKTLIDAELSKLDAYKAELEGQKLIGDLNVQQVEVYKARVTAAMSVVELFRAQVDAANLGLQANKIRIESFSAQVGAYDATVRAKATEYQGYATQVQAEVSKIELFKGEADAYGSQVAGFRALVDAAVAEKGIEIEVNQKVPLDLFKARTEVFRSLVNAEASRVDSLSKVYGVRAQVFGEEVRGESARVDAEVNTYKVEADVAIAEANVHVEAAKANVQALIQKVTVLVEAMKSGAQVAAQLAAAALSAVNLSGQISDHTSYNASNSASVSTSTNSASQVGDMTYHNLKTE